MQDQLDALAAVKKEDLARWVLACGASNKEISADWSDMRQEFPINKRPG